MCRSYSGDPASVAYACDSVNADRFWARVAKGEGCWVWTGAKSEGYGNVNLGGKRWERAHRIAYRLTNGAVPAGKMVLHHCDNKACVRPDHLYAGSPRDNVHDMLSRGRHVPHPALPADTVHSIAELRRQGLSYEAISKRLGIGIMTAWKYGRRACAES